MTDAEKIANWRAGINAGLSPKPSSPDTAQPVSAPFKPQSAAENSGDIQLSAPIDYEIRPSGMLRQASNPARKTIGANGMLSQPPQPAYAPEMVDMGVRNAAKPDPNWINTNKAQDDANAKRAQDKSDQQAAQESGGMSVVCTKIHSLGFMEDDVYEADERYGKILRQYNPEFMAWYTINAQPVVAAMHYNTLSSRLFTEALWYLLVNPWSQQMAFESSNIGKGSLFGKFLMWTGFKAFEFSRYISK
jgi:hypothetical protein